MSLHRNVWPEAIYFTRTTLFTYSELEVAITLPSFIALHFLVSEIAKWHEAVYWFFFTRTTFFFFFFFFFFMEEKIDYKKKTRQKTK